MTLESWLKISLPAFPVGFIILGVWLYWHENPLPLLPAPIAFWGVVILYYLFSHFDVPDKKYPLFLMITVSVCWAFASITAHALGKFFSTNQYCGIGSLMKNTDFWYSYLCAAVSSAVGLKQFRRLEPQIATQLALDRTEQKP